LEGRRVTGTGHIRNYLTHQDRNFQPQEDAFRDDFSRNQTDKAAMLYGTMGAERVEELLGYRFRNRSFLLQALTHASYSSNQLTESYERLEFLGDAVLDYLVTAHIFSDSQVWKDPGQVTDARSAIVNNNLLAGMVVDRGLHHFLLHCAPTLLQKVETYCEDRKRSSRNPQASLDMINEVEPPEVELVEVPKVLGDMLESLLGAVFLDSGHNLTTVWTVFRNLCPDLDMILRNPPCVNYKRKLLELYPGQNRVGFSSKVQTDAVVACVNLDVGGVAREWRGRGNNKKNAVLAACKQALRALG